MSDFTIYHNPRCSKSRQTLDLLREKGIEPTIVDYLSAPPSQKELDRILQLLDFTPSQLMRKKEDEFKLAGLNDESLSRKEQIKRMVAYPKVIERPIVVTKNAAVVGRPPENILKLIP